MQVFRQAFWVMLLIGLTGTADARSSVPIVNFEGNAIATASGKEPTLAAVADAIRAAAASQTYPWAASAESPGTMQLTTLVRNKHTVVVTVTFDTHTYSIRYASSVNMNYEVHGGREIIHPNYNNWVQQLKQAIDFRLRSL